MRRLSGWSLIGIVGLTAMSGCMMPAYRFPAGFSSSFQRHLYSQNPRAVPHQLPLSHDDAVIDEFQRPMGPQAEVIAPEDEQPPLKAPENPIDPGTHPSPPAPLPEDDLETQPEGPSAGPTNNDTAVRANYRKSLPNTAMSLPR